MSCIIGIVGEDNIMFASDSNYYKPPGSATQITVCKKIYKYRNFIVGVSGALKLNFELEADRKLLNSFETIKEIYRYFQQQGKNGAWNSNEILIGIGISKKLYVIESSLQILELKSNFGAVGCGGVIAYGALEAFNYFGELDATIHVCKTIVKIVIKYDSGVNGRVRIVEFKK